MKKWAIGLGVVVIVAAAAVGVTFYAQAWAVRQVDAILAQAPITKASHGAVAYVLWRGEITVEDVTVETSLPDIVEAHAARFEIEGIGPLAFASQAADLSASAIRLDRPEGRDRDGRHWSLAALTLDEPKLRAPATLATTDDFIRQLSFKRLAARDSQVWYGEGDHDRTFENLTLDTLVEGRLGTLTVTKFVADVPNAELPDRKTHMEISEVRVGGVDIVALRQAFDGAAQAQAAIHTLAGDIVLSGVAIRDGTTTLTIDRAAASEVRLYGTERPRAGASADSGAFLLRSIGFDELELKKLAIEQSSGTGGHATIGQLTIEGVQPGHVGKMEIGDAALDFASSATATVAKFSLAGVVYPPSSVSDPLTPRIFLEQLELADAAVTWGPVGSTSIKSLTMAMTGPAEQPRAMSVMAKEHRVTSVWLAPMLKKLGYDQALFDWQITGAYDPDRATGESHIALAAPSAGTLSVAAFFSNVPAPSRTADTAARMQHMLEMAVDRFEIRYDDASLVDRLMGLYATMTKRDVEAVRGDLIAQVQTLRKQIPAPAGAKLDYDGIIAFLRTPRTLTLTAAPPRPVPLGALSAMKALKTEDQVKMLGVSVH